MEKHHFDDCQIRIDHKNEELEIQVSRNSRKNKRQKHFVCSKIKQNRRSVASLSGGERSISTFCFLLALWESIYQPFRLLDEIDIYMVRRKTKLESFRSERFSFSRIMKNEIRLWICFMKIHDIIRPLNM